MSYTPTTWAAGDTVTAAKLNKLEQGVASGGVLVVHVAPNEATFTMDKTYSEIKSADAVLVKFFNALCPVLAIVDAGKQNDNTVSVAVCVKDGGNVQWNLVDFTVLDADGYPSHTFE